MNRNELRSTLLGNVNRKFQSEKHTLFGMEIEIRQPSLRESLKSEEEIGKDTARGLAMMIINYCYVPGTDEKIFEVADIDSILAWPLSPDVIKLNKIVSKLTGINIEEAEGNSEKTAS